MSLKIAVSDHKVEKWTQTACVMNGFEVHLLTAGHNSDPEVPVQPGEDFGNTGDDQGGSAFKQHTVVDDIAAPARLLRRFRRVAQRNNDVRQAHSFGETQLGEFGFIQFHAEFFKHVTVRLVEHAFGIDEHTVIVEKDG